MPYYLYTGIDPKGRKIRGSMYSITEQDTLTKLKQSQIQVKSIKVSKIRELIEKMEGDVTKKLKDTELIYFFSYINEMTRGGVSIIDTMKYMYEETRFPKLKKLAYKLFTTIGAGSNLGDAMNQHKKCFNPLFCNLIRAGEETNNVQQSLEYIIQYIKLNSELAKKIKSSMVYPAFLLILGIGMVFGASKFVIPKYAGFLSITGSEIPWYTSSLLDFSSFVSDNLWGLLGGIFSLFFLPMIFGLLSPKIRYKVDSFLLKLPMVGDFIKKIEITRFSVFYSTMYVSGIRIVDALRDAATVVNNRVMRSELEIVRAQVITGKSIAMCFASMRTLPRFALRMFRIAENSGDIQSCVDNIVYFYTKDINQAAGALAGAIKPVFLLIVGSFMMWIVAAVFIPVYSQIASSGIV